VKARANQFFDLRNLKQVATIKLRGEAPAYPAGSSLQFEGEKTSVSDWNVLPDFFSGSIASHSTIAEKRLTVIQLVRLRPRLASNLPWPMNEENGH
jgi:hypothetical protein